MYKKARRACKVVVFCAGLNLLLFCCSRCRLRRRCFISSLVSTECFHMTSWRPYWCPKTMKRRPCWCPKTILWELNSFLMQTLPFVPINLHRCWPREWKHSIRRLSQGEMWQYNPVAESNPQASSRGPISPRSWEKRGRLVSKITFSNLRA